MGKEKREDPVMDRIRVLIAERGVTQQELGERMGYGPTSARQAVSQFLKSGDPQVSMVRRCAEALGVPLSELLD